MEGLNIFFEVQGITIKSALKMDDYYLKLLAKAGMKKVHFGVESGSERILDKINKKLKVEDVIKVNRIWSKHDIVCQYNFMCGFPGETIEDIKVTRDLIFQIMSDNPNALISPLCPFTPYPGTALYDQALKDGFLDKRRLEDWCDTDYGDNLWKSPQRAKMLSSLFFASMFLDSHRSKDMFPSRILRTMIDLYRPIAKFRVKHLFFKFMPELKVKKALFG